MLVEEQKKEQEKEQEEEQEEEQKDDQEEEQEEDQKEKRKGEHEEELEEEPLPITNFRFTFNKEPTQQPRAVQHQGRNMGDRNLAIENTMLLSGGKDREHHAAVRR